MKIIILDEVTSTNDYVRRYIEGGETVAVAAKKQTKGRGTKGRSFISDEGGLYVSILRFYDNLKAENAYSIISDTAVAVVKTLSAFGVETKIKWPNDIYYKGKKMCGILTESMIYGDGIVYSVTGIGINVNNEIAPEIADIAVSAKQAAGKDLPIDRVLATLLYNLEQKQEAGKVLRKAHELMQQQLESLDASYKRILNPHIYKVSLTQAMKDLKIQFIEKRISESAKTDRI